MKISPVGLVPRPGSPGCNPRVKNVRQSRGAGSGEGGHIAFEGHSWASPVLQEKPPLASQTHFTSFHDPAPAAVRRSPYALSRLVASLPRRLSDGGSLSRRRLLEEQDWPWSFPRPSHPLPASLLGNKGASGSWALLVPGPTPTPALLMWNRVWALPGYCLRWGRGQAGAGNSARSRLHQVPPTGGLCPTACLPQPNKGYTSPN